MEHRAVRTSSLAAVFTRPCARLGMLGLLVVTTSLVLSASAGAAGRDESQDSPKKEDPPEPSSRAGVEPEGPGREASRGRRPGWHRGPRSDKRGPPQAGPRRGSPPDRGTDRAPEQPEDKTRLRLQRERWEKLSADRRQQLRELHERLQKLSPEQRRQLFERMRALNDEDRRQKIRSAGERVGGDRWIEHHRRRARRDVFGRLPAQLREKLEGVPPEQHDEQVQKWFAAERDRMIASLPEKERERVKKLPPREQAQALRRYRTESVFADTFRDPKEADALKAMSPGELRLLLRVDDNAGKALPAPAPLSAATWTRWRALQFYERVRVIHSLHPPQGGPWFRGGDSRGPRADRRGDMTRPGRDGDHRRGRSRRGEGGPRPSRPVGDAKASDAPVEGAPDAGGAERPER